MAELEKVIKGLERCKLYNKLNCDKCPYDYNGRGNGKSECTAELASDVLELLKEQDDMGKELGDAVELIHKKNERIEKLLKEQEVVVRCKDCKHGEKANDVYLCGKPRGFGLAHEPNWFCADGERRNRRAYEEI